jgi:outer membrane protein OmpA-like peptidoglycan-associated protein
VGSPNSAILSPPFVFSLFFKPNNPSPAPSSFLLADRISIQRDGHEERSALFVPSPQPEDGKMKSITKSLTGMITGTIIALTLTASPSQAQNAHYLAQDASHCEIFRGLSRDLPAECGAVAAKSTYPTLRSFGRTRGLVIYGDKQPTRVAAVATKASATTAEAPKDLSIAFRAEFEFDSFRLTPDAKIIIDRVAKVLKHDLMNKKVIEIQGHADARGEEIYNMSLSEKRAHAVTDYLVKKHGIDPARLKFVGKGEAEPYDPSNPTAAINRRVEFKNITG